MLTIEAVPLRQTATVRPLPWVNRVAEMAGVIEVAGVTGWPQ
ncbi:hypothetical protein [Kitasatospora sp. NBC_01266]|nr:hypothetical protein [Kitasatospora sp. NBC_01266]